MENKQVEFALKMLTIPELTNDAKEAASKCIVAYLVSLEPSKSEEQIR